MPDESGLVASIGDGSPSLAGLAADAVQEAIRTGRLVPGQLYSVHQLAAEMGVSRSPVREALLRLAETGMIRFERSRGFRVQVPGPREVAEALSVRLALEVPAARLAARYATPSALARLEGKLGEMSESAAEDDEAAFMHHDQLFHGLIFDIGGNGYAKKIVENIRNATRLVGVSTTADRSLIEIYKAHVAIVHALEARDPQAPAAAMAAHIETTGRLLVRKALQASQTAPTDDESLWDRLVPPS